MFPSPLKIIPKIRAESLLLTFQKYLVSLVFVQEYLNVGLCLPQHMTKCSENHFYIDLSLCLSVL